MNLKIDTMEEENEDKKKANITIKSPIGCGLIIIIWIVCTTIYEVIKVIYDK